MDLKKIVCGSILLGGLAGYSAGSQIEKIFPYEKAEQIAEVPKDYLRGSIGLAAADFDGDGDIDLAVVRNCKEGGKVFLYKNDGQGNYILAGQIAEVPKDYLRGGIGLAAADFDGDGDIDLAVVRNCKEGGKVILYKNIGLTD